MMKVHTNDFLTLRSRGNLNGLRYYTTATNGMAAVCKRTTRTGWQAISCSSLGNAASVLQVNAAESMDGLAPSVQEDPALDTNVTVHADGTDELSMLEAGSARCQTGKTLNFGGAQSAIHATQFQSNVALYDFNNNFLKTTCKANTCASMTMMKVHTNDFLTLRSRGNLNGLRYYTTATNGMAAVCKRTTRTGWQAISCSSLGNAASVLQVDAAESMIGLGQRVQEEPPRDTNVTVHVNESDGEI